MTKAELTESFQKLTSQKEEIELELKGLEQIINPVGMHEPLVDASGFPRADVDVYSIRHARNKIICNVSHFPRIYI